MKLKMSMITCCPPLTSEGWQLVLELHVLVHHLLHVVSDLELQLCMIAQKAKRR